MSYHTNPKINSALILLLDELGAHERETGQHSTLILIPNSVSGVIVAKDGKPVSISVNEAVKLAFMEISK